MSDIEDEGFDAIWVDATPEEIEATRDAARRSSAVFDALIAQEKLDGTWQPLTPVPDPAGDEYPPY